MKKIAKLILTLGILLNVTACSNPKELKLSVTLEKIARASNYDYNMEATGKMLVLVSTNGNTESLDATFSFNAENMDNMDELLMGVALEAVTKSNTRGDSADRMEFYVVDKVSYLTDGVSYSKQILENNIFNQEQLEEIEKADYTQFDKYDQYFKVTENNDEITIEFKKEKSKELLVAVVEEQYKDTMSSGEIRMMLALFKADSTVFEVTTKLVYDKEYRLKSVDMGMKFSMDIMEESMEINMQINDMKVSYYKDETKIKLPDLTRWDETEVE